jgi:hypothetical protein
MREEEEVTLEARLNKINQSRSNLSADKMLASKMGCNLIDLI